MLDVEGESALEAAQRELAEEALLTAAEWHALIDLYPSPGMSSEAIRIFLARELAPVPESHGFVAQHEELTLTIEPLPLATLVEAALAGTLTNAAAVAGVLAAARAVERGIGTLRPADAPWSARPGR